MTTNYPNDYDNLSNPTSTSKLNAPSHSEQHSNANDSIEAIEHTLGLNPEGSDIDVAARLDRIEAVSTADAVTDGDAAGGDLGSTYPNPSVVAIRGTGVSNTPPASGEALVYNGSQYVPANIATQAELDAHTTDSSAAHAASAISFAPTGTVAATDVQAAIAEVASEALQSGASAGGDLTGNYPNPTVTKIRGTTVSNTSPSNGTALVYNGTQYVPVDIATQTELDAHTSATAPHSGHELTSNKGAANGYAELNESTLVPVAQMGSGSANNTNFLRGDGTWASPPSTNTPQVYISTLSTTSSAPVATANAAAINSAISTIVGFDVTLTPTTVAAGSNGVDTATFAGAGTLNVVDTTNRFPSSGTACIGIGTASPGTAVKVEITYTGKTSNTLTGVTRTAGTGTLTTGDMVYPMPTSGGVITLPPSTEEVPFEISSAIILPNGIEVYGQGMRRTYLKQREGSNLDAMFAGYYWWHNCARDLTGTGESEGQYGIRISDLSIDCNHRDWTSTTTLSADATDSATTLSFTLRQNVSGKTIIVGSEFITVPSTGNTGNGTITGCTRGVYGSTAVAHTSGDKIGIMRNVCTTNNRTTTLVGDGHGIALGAMSRSGIYDVEILRPYGCGVFLDVLGRNRTTVVGFGIQWFIERVWVAYPGMCGFHNTGVNDGHITDWYAYNVNQLDLNTSSSGGNYANQFYGHYIYENDGGGTVYKGGHGYGDYTPGGNNAYPGSRCKNGVWIQAAASRLLGLMVTDFGQGSNDGVATTYYGIYAQVYYKRGTTLIGCKVHPDLDNNLHTKWCYRISTQQAAGTSSDFSMSGCIASARTDSARKAVPTVTPATTLNGSIADTVTTTVVVTSASGAVPLAAGDVILVEDECIRLGTKSTNTFTNCVRGWANTIPASHANSTNVFKMSVNGVQLHRQTSGAYLTGSIDGCSMKMVNNQFDGMNSDAASRVNITGNSWQRAASIPVAGYWTAGSRIDNSSAATGQPLGWVCTTAGTPGTWVALRASDMINVKDYGAVGNASADDTTALHAARDAASTNGHVYVPPGTYMVSGLVLNVLAQKWTLHPNATIKAINTSTTAITVSAASVVLEGGNVDGLWTDRTAPGSNPAIRIDKDGSNCRVESTTITNAGTYGVYGAAADGLILRNLRIVDSGQSSINCDTDSGQSGATNTEGILIDGCRVDRTGWNHSVISGGGIKVFGDSASPTLTTSRVRITNCEVRTPYRANVSYAGCTAATDDYFTVTGHKFLVGEKVTVSSVTGSITITGHTLTNQDYWVSAITTNKIKLALTSGGATLDITAQSGFSCTISIDGNDNECIVVKENLLGATVTGCVTRGGTMGVSVSGAYSATVTGNNISGFSKQGIECAGSLSHVISSNSIDGAVDIATYSSGNATTPSYGIVIWNEAGSGSDVRRCTVNGNSIRNLGTAASAGIRISDNTTGSELDWNVTGNSIVVGGSSADGIQLPNANIVGVVAANMIDGSEASGTSRYAISFTGAVTKISVTGNTTTAFGTDVRFNGSGAVSELTFVGNCFTAATAYSKNSGITYGSRFRWEGNTGSAAAAVDISPGLTRLGDGVQSYPWAGGGGYSSIDVNPFDEACVAIGTDTAGVHIVRDGDPYVHNAGMNAAMFGIATVRWSRRIRGRLYATGGGGRTSTSWMAICDRADTNAPTDWKCFQIYSGADPLLCFSDGGDFDATYVGGVRTVSESGGFPRSPGYNLVEDVDFTRTVASGGTHYYVWVGNYYSRQYPDVNPSSAEAGAGGVYRLEIPVDFNDLPSDPLNPSDSPIGYTHLAVATSTDPKSVKTLVGFNPDIRTWSTTSLYDTFFAATYDHDGAVLNAAETSPLVTLTRSSNVVTAVFQANHWLTVGASIKVYGAGDSGFDGTFTVASVTAGTVTWAQTAANATTTGAVSLASAGGAVYRLTTMDGTMAAAKMTGTNAPSNVVALDYFQSAFENKFVLAAAGLDGLLSVIVTQESPQDDPDTGDTWRSIAPVSGVDYSAVKVWESIRAAKVTQAGAATAGSLVSYDCVVLASVVKPAAITAYGTVDYDPRVGIWRGTFNLTSEETQSADITSEDWVPLTGENMRPAPFGSGGRATTAQFVRTTTTNSNAPINERWTPVWVGHDASDVVAQFASARFFPSRVVLCARTFCSISDDGGLNWTVFGTPPNTGHKTLAQSADGARLVTGSTDHPAIGSLDGGDTWQSLLLADNGTANKVSSSTAAWWGHDDTRIFVAAKDTGILPTNNGLFSTADPWLGRRSTSQRHWDCLTAIDTETPISGLTKDTTSTYVGPGFPTPGGTQPAIMGGITIEAADGDLVVVGLDASYGVWYCKVNAAYAASIKDWTFANSASASSALRGGTLGQGRSRFKAVEFAYDSATEMLYVVDFGNYRTTSVGSTYGGGGVWRFAIDTAAGSGTLVDGGTRIAGWNTPTALDTGPSNSGGDCSAGLALDPNVADRIWFTHNGELYYLDDASTSASASNLSAATGVFQAGYAGEYAAKVVFDSDDGAMWFASAAWTATEPVAAGARLFRLPVGVDTPTAAYEVTNDRWRSYATHPNKMVVYRQKVTVISEQSGIAQFDFRARV